MPCPGILGSIRLGRLKAPTPSFTHIWAGGLASQALMCPPKRQLPVTLGVINHNIDKIMNMAYYNRRMLYEKT